MHCNCLIWRGETRSINIFVQMTFFFSFFFCWKEFLTKVWEERFSFSANLLSVQSSLLLSTAPQTFSPQGWVSVASNYPNFFISCSCASPALPKSTPHLPPPRDDNRLNFPRWNHHDFSSRRPPIFHSPSQLTSHAARCRRLGTFICTPGCVLTPLLKYPPLAVPLTHRRINMTADPEARYTFNAHVMW